MGNFNINGVEVSMFRLMSGQGTIKVPKQLASAIGIVNSVLFIELSDIYGANPNETGVLTIHIDELRRETILNNDELEIALKDLVKYNLIVVNYSQHHFVLTITFLI